MLTVREICDHYLRELQSRGRDRTAKDAEYRFRLHVRPPFSDIRMDKLRARHVKAWRDGLDGITPATAHRIMSTVYAAFNLAYREGLASDKSAWESVQKPSAQGQRRERWLTIEERRALIANCPPDLRAFVMGLLLTAARPGELAACTVANFDPAAGTLRYPSGKTGGRVITLTEETAELCRDQARAKLPGAWLFSRASGEQWSKDGWHRPFAEAAKVVGAGVTLYTLRHTSISEMIAGGLDPFTVARFAGTSTAMIDKHYGHLLHGRVRDRLAAVKIT